MAAGGGECSLGVHWRAVFETAQKNSGPQIKCKRGYNCNNREWSLS
jgi:hypothetical protein